MRTHQLKLPIGRKAASKPTPRLRSPQPFRAGEGRQAPRVTATYQDTVEGRIVRIPTHQLLMAWWLYQGKHITLRQLRVALAAREMAERRRFSGEDCERALYTLDELKALVGGKGSDSATRELSADVQRLGSIGLVQIERHRIVFATSIEQLDLGLRGDDQGTCSLESFWSLANHTLFQNKRRVVHVPRRTLRALAGGFAKAETALILTALVRCVFWHKAGSRGGPPSSSDRPGHYRIDGRLKLAEVADAMAISRKRLSEARRRLEGLGWLRTEDTPQTLLNRYGLHLVVNVDWTPDAEGSNTEDPDTEDLDTEGSTDEGPAEELSSIEEPNAVGAGRLGTTTRNDPGGTTSPKAPNAGGTTSPGKQVPSSSKNLETRRLGSGPPRRTGPGPAGVSSKTRRRGRASIGKPSLHDIQAKDLEDPKRLLELHRQAVARGWAQGSTAGELSFFSLAHRARARGARPGALFRWLLEHRREDFITQTDEDAGALMLRELRDGPARRSVTLPDLRPVGAGRFGPGTGQASTDQRELTEDQRFVEACILSAKRVRGIEPFRIAQRVLGWTKEQWDTALLSYEVQQRARYLDHDAEAAWPAV